MVFLAIIILLFCVGILVSKVIFDALKGKGRLFGLTFRPLDCPKCGERVPYARKPLSIRQALWGGWTCINCGAELDKWGTDISSSVEARNGSSKLSDGLNPILPFDVTGKTPIERVFLDEDK
jgi:DNA-directed RNA polymerase subunit RPC12/RpoP